MQPKNFKPYQLSFLQYWAEKHGFVHLWGGALKINFSNAMRELLVIAARAEPDDPKCRDFVDIYEWQKRSEDKANEFKKKFDGDASAIRDHKAASER